MFEYTKNNHLKIHYDNFRVEHGTVITHSTFRQECKLAALDLYNKHGNNLNLFLSGGVDSEVMLLSFIANGIIPNVTILKYERNLNMHDINYALRLCARYAIAPNIVDINVEKFFNDKLIDFAYETKCSSPQLNLIAYHANFTAGIPVLAFGENFLTRIKERYKLSTEVYDIEQEKETRVFTYFVNNYRKSIPAFFQYTPEQMISFLQRESVYKWVETAKDLKYVNTNKVKLSMLSEEFDIEVRPKLNGFELMNELDAEYRFKLIKLLGPAPPPRANYTEFTEYVKSFNVPLLREIKYNNDKA